MTDTLGVRPLWLRVYGNVAQPLPADCHHVGHLSLTVGARGVGEVMTMVVAAVSAVLVLSAAMAGAWSWRRSTRSVTAPAHGATSPAPDLESVHIQLRREFAMVAGIAAGLPESVTARIPSLDDRIGVAAHSADRLLTTVRRTPLDAPVVDACARRARRLGSAVVELHRVLVSARLAQAAPADAVTQALVAIDQEVDGLYLEVITAVPSSAEET